jgi:hypothetical protein
MVHTESKCRYCGKTPCPDDCEELAMIYREQQKEKLRDLDFDEEELAEYRESLSYQVYEE